MKVITFNVNSIRTRLPILEKLLREEHPDVLLLQELKCESHTFPTDFFRELGYNSTMLGQKSYNGVAVVSRTRPDDVIEGLPTYLEDTSARFLDAVIGGIHFISAYMPNGDNTESPKFIYKIKWLDALTEYLKILEKQKETVVLGGDFNIVLTPEDGYDEKAYQKAKSALVAEEGRTRMRGWLSHYWVGAFQKLYPHEHKPTWWDYRTRVLNLDRGLCLDYFLVNAELASKLKSCTILSEYRTLERPSDHAPVALEF